MSISTLKKFEAFQAPTRYIFVDPDVAGKQYTATNLAALLQIIRWYREQNKLSPIEALESVVENYLCSLPENAGKCRPVPLRRGWLSRLKGGISLVEMIMFKRFVDPKTAEARALQCTNCPNNVFPEESGFDAWADEIALNCTDGRRVSLHDKLGVCAVCECNLRAKVFYGGSIEIDPAHMEAFKAVNCWQLKQMTLLPSANKAS